LREKENGSALASFGKEANLANEIEKLADLSNSYRSPSRTTNAQPNRHLHEEHQNESLDEEFLNNQNSPTTIVSKPLTVNNLSPGLKKKGRDKRAKEADMLSVLGATNFYKDSFMIRYNSNSVFSRNRVDLAMRDSKILTREEFTEEIEGCRQNNPYWKTISKVQLAP
jgi:hypothetical protein